MTFPARLKAAVKRLLAGRLKGRIVFYNLREGRSQVQVSKEIAALLEHYRPEVAGFCEGVGYARPSVSGYTLLSDRSTPSRANVFAYVRSDLLVEGARWVDLHETWARTDHPGTHEARSYLTFKAGTTRVVVAHQPPRAAGAAAQQEGIRAILRLMAPWSTGGRRIISRRRSRLVIGDLNAKVQDPIFGALAIARRCRGQKIGRTIDSGVLRHGLATAIEYVAYAGDVHLESDHKTALTFIIS